MSSKVDLKTFLMPNKKKGLTMVVIISVMLVTSYFIGQISRLIMTEEQVESLAMTILSEYPSFISIGIIMSINFWAILIIASYIGACIIVNIINGK